MKYGTPTFNVIKFVFHNFFLDAKVVIDTKVFMRIKVLKKIRFSAKTQNVKRFNSICPHID